MKRRLVVIFFLCLYSLVGMAQEVKIYPERTVYYKSGINNELVWVSEENYIKELTWFQYNETYISLNFYIGEYRYTYFFDYEYSETKNFDEEIQYWRSAVNNALMVVEDSTITIYSFRDSWAVVFHINE
jgi:hypothetical protein